MATSTHNANLARFEAIFGVGKRQRRTFGGYIPIRLRRVVDDGDIDVDAVRDLAEETADDAEDAEQAFAATKHLVDEAADLLVEAGAHPDRQTALRHLLS